MSSRSGDRSGGQVEGGVHQADVGEGLGEVANQAIVARVVLLRQQSEIVAQAEQALVEADCLVTAAQDGEGVNQPEAAREEDPLVTGETVGIPSSSVR
jgi:hypothetical protein